MIGGLQQPVLNAGPFILRRFLAQDVDLIREASADPHIPLITTVPPVFTEEDARRFIQRQWDRPEQGVGYSFAIADARTGKGLGQVGLWLKNLPSGRADTGYWLAPSCRGRGAATEALRAVSVWGLTVLRIPRLELYVEPWNSASWRVAERVGYRREGLMRSWQQVGAERRDMFMYSLLEGDLPA